jgi:hypothetical protein
VYSSNSWPGDPKGYGLVMKPASRVLAASAAALVLLLCSSCAQIRVQRPSLHGALDLAPLQSGQIVVWVSARRGYYPPAVAASFAKDFPAANLVQLEIPAESFIGEIQTKAAHQPPDLAFVSHHFTQVQPLLDAKAIWLAWGRPRFDTIGWWVIFKDTKRLAKAQAFVRWLSRAPGWQPSAHSASMSREAVEAVQKISITALHATVSGNQAALEALLDKDAARSRRMPADPSARVSDVQPIFTFGNARIAFVMLSVLASGDTFYGVRHMIFILRNQGAGWRILQMNPDAQMPARPDDVNPPLLRAFDSGIGSNRAEPPPPPAILVDPPDRAVLPRFPDRPDITWRSEAPAGASFVVESQFTNPGDEVNWSASNLVFAQASRVEQPFRERAPFGVGQQPHRWRIWTLGASGAISVSSWRTVVFSN